MLIVTHLLRGFVTGRRVKNYDSQNQQQPAHELGFGYYYQGDIMLPTEPKGQDRLSVAEEYTSTVWPNGIVPYYIAPNTFCTYLSVFLEFG